MAQPVTATKLLYITTVPETLNFLTGQVQYMQSKGLEVYALSSPGAFLQQFAERENVITYSVEMPRRITPLQDLVAILRIWQYLHQLRPQIVHTNTPKGGLLGTLAAWLAGSPVRIYHMRGLPLMTATGFRRWLLRWSEKVSCSLAHQVICVSHSLREVAISEKLCAADKIKVLLGGSSNGVNADRFNPAMVDATIGLSIRQRYGIPADALVIGFIGRIVQDKGITELVEAWKILKPELPNLHLLLVGPFESQNSLAADVEAVLKHDPRIHLVGLDWDTPPFYAAMDLLTLPTYREGFPNTLLEAAAMQLPVVATRIPGCIDAVQDGVTGILVPLYDVQALTAALRIYLEDAARRTRQGRAGRERVLKDYCQSAIWEAVYQEYTSCLAKAGLPIPPSIPTPSNDFTPNLSDSLLKISSGKGMKFSR